MMEALISVDFAPPRTISLRLFSLPFLSKKSCPVLPGQLLNIVAYIERKRQAFYRRSLPPKIKVLDLTATPYDRKKTLLVICIYLACNISCMQNFVSLVASI